MTDWIGIVATVVSLVIISCIGWYLSIRAAAKVARTALDEAEKGNNIKKAQLQGMENQRDIARDRRIDNLPCLVDPNYMVRQGSFMQKMEDCIRRLERIEIKINGDYKRPE